MKIAPKNWKSFQHYKDRNPAWIKLHKQLLDDFEFQCLPLASRALAPMLWLLASEHQDGVIDAEPEKLAFRLRWNIEDVKAAIGPLIGKGFFEVVQFASTALAEPERGASPEKEREVERERETEKRQSRDPPPDSAASRAAAGLEVLKTRALALGEARIPGGDETPAGHLASVLRANGLKGNAFHPLVVEWARDGITVAKLQEAIAKARQRPGKEKGVFGPEYLDPILHDETKPAARVQAERNQANAGKAIERTQKLIAEQRTRERAPMPEHLRPKPTLQ